MAPEKQLRVEKLISAANPTVSQCRRLFLVILKMEANGKYKTVEFLHELDAK